MRKNTLLLVGSVVLLASPATAANFTGPRIEARGGWDRTTIDLSYDDGVDSISGSDHKDGFNVGAELGYDALIGSNVVAGVYAGAEYASTKSCSEVFGNDELCLKLGRNFTVGGRLGAKVSPMAMIYVKGGYSNGQLKATYTDLADPTLNDSEHSNRGGMHFGAGAEIAVGSFTNVRAEYVRTEYNGYHNADSDIDAKLDGHRDQALVGFGLRF